MTQKAIFANGQIHERRSTCACSHCGPRYLFGTRMILFLRLAVAVVLAVLVLLLPVPRVLTYILCVLAFILAGGDLLYTAIRNLPGKKGLDKSLLVSVAGITCLIAGGPAEAVLLMVLFQVGELLEDYALDNARKPLSRLDELCPERVNVVRGGAIVSIPTGQAEVGEHMLVKPGERVALDGIVVSGNSAVDTSPLTGILTPKSISEGDRVLAGWINQSGALSVQITAPADRSTAARIRQFVEEPGRERATPERLSARYARPYMLIMILLALLIAVLPPIFGAAWIPWIRRGLVLLLLSSPCSALISIPLSYLSAIVGATRNGIFFRGSASMECTAKIGTIAFDETGTLRGETVTLSSIEPTHGITTEMLLMLAAYAEAFSTNTLAPAVLKAYGKTVERKKVVESRNFDGLGTAVQMPGLTICCGNRPFMERLGVADVAYDETEPVLYVALNNRYAGKLRFTGAPNSDAKSAVFQLKSLGVARVVMLSGDSQAVAEPRAAELAVTELHASCGPAEQAACLEQLVNSRRGNERIAFAAGPTCDAKVFSLADLGIRLHALEAGVPEPYGLGIAGGAPSKIAEAISIARNTGAIVQQNLLFSAGIKLILLILGLVGIAAPWLALFADECVTFLVTLNAMRAADTDNS